MLQELPKDYLKAFWPMGIHRYERALLSIPEEPVPAPPWKKDASMYRKTTG